MIVPEGASLSPIQQLEFGPDLIWQAPLLALLIFLASSMGTVFAERLVPSRGDRVKASRASGTETLDAVLAFQIALDSRNATVGDDPVADAKILALRAALLVAAAKSGSESLRAKVRSYATLGTKWAIGTPTVLEVQVVTAFEELLAEVAKFMRKNR